MFRKISLQLGLIKSSAFVINTSAELFIAILRKLTNEEKPSFFSDLSHALSEDEQIYMGVSSVSDFLLSRVSKRESIINKDRKILGQTIKIKGVIDTSSSGINVSVNFISKSQSVFYTHLVIAFLALLIFILFRQKSDMLSGGCLIWFLGEVINLPILFFLIKNSVETTAEEFKELVISQFEYTQY